jgi:hypothetical protein
VPEAIDLLPEKNVYFVLDGRAEIEARRRQVISQLWFSFFVFLL